MIPLPLVELAKVKPVAIIVEPVVIWRAKRPDVLFVDDVIVDPPRTIDPDVTVIPEPVVEVDAVIVPVIDRIELF